VKPYADAPSDEPIELRVYPGANCAFALYDDRGNGYGYENGEYSLVSLTWNDHAHALILAGRQGSYDGMPAATRFIVVCGGVPAVTARATYTGKAMTVPLPACR
jgi:alpha-D-xyloside xylohydrolase